MFTPSTRHIALGPAFLMCFAAGAGFILLSTSSGRESSTLIGTGGPLFTMAIYLAIGWQSVKHAGSYSEEQLADSLYFMGFLFTLVALIRALAGLSAIDTSSIISQFSLALTTTLFGLFCRVMLTQFGEQTQSRSRRLEDRISESMTAFQRSLDASARSLDQHVTAVNARTEQMLDTCLTELQAMSNKHLSEATAQSDLAMQAVHTRLEKSTEYAEQLDTRLSAIINQIENTATDSVEQFSSALGAAAAPISTQATEVSKKLSDLSEMLNALTNQQQELALELSRTRQDSESERELLEALSQALANTRDHKSSLQNLITALENGSDNTSAALVSAVQDSQKALSLSIENASRPLHDLGSLQGDIARMRNTLDDIPGEMTALVAEVITRLEAQTEVLQHSAIAAEDSDQARAASFSWPFGSRKEASQTSRSSIGHSSSSHPASNGGTHPDEPAA